MIMNNTFYRWKHKSFNFFKIGSLTAVLALISFYSAHSSRYGSYYDEEYPDENYHRQFQGLSISKTQPVTKSPFKPKNHYTATQYTEVPYSIPYYPARCALWLTETPAHIATKYTGAPPETYTGAKLKLASIVGKNGISWDLSVENQGELGTCASFAVVEALKFLHNRMLSQPYLIVKAEARENCLNDGLTIGSAMWAKMVAL
ncbi:hypothetical protein IM40_01760 [Candidatus Paracaedimonas acanthamoebae]|nr:hypothetical protein IM40_01760 [Candidatus Paracaedimonas acanthamoebae]